MLRTSLFAAVLGCLAVPGLAAGSGTDEWLSLDKEIAELAQATATAQQAEAPKGIQVSAWIKTHYDNSNDEAYEPAPDTDLSGFGFESLRINFTGKIGAYELKLSMDGKSGTMQLRDAYVRFQIAENFHGWMGNFKSRFLFSSWESDDKMITYRRTALGYAYNVRDVGVMLDYLLGPVLVLGQLQNGDDSAGDEWAITGKAIVTAIGKPIEKQSGGYGPDAETALTFGLGYFDDSNVDETTAISAEAMFTSGPFWAHGEIVDHDDGFSGLTAGPAQDASERGGTTPWDATLAFMFSANVELIGRYEDADDDADTSTILGGVNYYVNGHATKWQLNYSVTDSDDADQDGDLLTLGLVVAV
jgi:hypothetical protein